MSESARPLDKLLATLQERDKELKCLYRIEELLSDPGRSLDSIFPGVIEAIPPAWRYPEYCIARITFEDVSWQSPDFVETTWRLRAEITVLGETLGYVEVLYNREIPTGDNDPFLHEEAKLTQTIADRLGQFIQYQRLHTAMQAWQTAKAGGPQEDAKGEWRVVVDLLMRTDQNLMRRITQKMLIRLCWSGVPEAEQLFQSLGSDRKTEATADPYENRPTERMYLLDFAALSQQVFAIAAAHLTDEEILASVQKWVQEDRSSFLVKALASYSSSMTEIVEAVRRFQQMMGEIELSPATQKEVRVSLIRRFFTEQLDYINVAKNYVEISDFFDLLNRIIYPTDSHGQLGGKSAGLFLASRIIKQASTHMEILRNIKVPRTWYVASDGLLSFTNYNNLGELVEHKYKEIDQIRREYGQIVQLFKHSNFTPEIVQGLSMALDDFDEKPLIVRSSSLLEDRLSSAFSGKYKSLFLANQGPKRERLEALMDAVAEVYSSTFGPDPIEYRAERGLLDFPEEMGIMIQEVVGTRVGKYLMPVYAGVAFSHNEFRWSPRIQREDGLVRLVMGLGTRAVDRLADDYPVLVAPGQPGLRVNITTEEVMRYAPNKIDLINLETNTFETVDARTFLREFGEQVPAIHNMVSLLRDHQIQRPTGLHLDAEQNELVITFEGLVTRTPFMKQMRAILTVLQEKLGTPVDIEFASDGRDFYLLQCRPQCYSRDAVPMPIPHDVPAERVVFTAHRFVSNGRMPDISHVVYVDPTRYTEITDLKTLMDVGHAVGRLNVLLPRRHFILMGPGRWGSRGDIKLGVNVTYSEIKNTAALIEVARKHGNYVPDLSFGTHFFQDLVESSIRYLPLYPDDPGTVFNEDFLLNSHNSLAEILPEYAHLGEVLRVIHVPEVAEGQVLRVLANADLDEAIAYLTRATATVSKAENRPLALQ
jgi:pyruvate, water dikinase